MLNSPLEKGSSLIEVIFIISIALFTVSALAFLLWQTTSTQYSAQALLAATTVAQDILRVDTYNLEGSPKT